LRPADNLSSTTPVALMPGAGTRFRGDQYLKCHCAPDGTTSALVFLNASPRQGAGEVSGYARNDGSVVIFYLEPGSD